MVSHDLNFIADFDRVICIDNNSIAADGEPSEVIQMYTDRIMGGLMRQNIPLGVYVPGTTIIHRLNPSIKFVSLIVFIIASTIWAHTLTHAAICLAVPLLLLTVAKIPPKIAWGQLWPPLPFLLFLGAFNWWQQGWEKALVVTLVIMSSIGMAAVLTLTTTVAEMLEALEKTLAPTARFGVPVEAISLAISLTIRLIPLQFATAAKFSTPARHAALTSPSPPLARP